MRTREPLMLQTRDIVSGDLGCGAGRKAVIRQPVKEFRGHGITKTYQIKSRGGPVPSGKVQGFEAG